VFDETSVAFSTLTGFDEGMNRINRSVDMALNAQRSALTKQKHSFDRAFTRLTFETSDYGDSIAFFLLRAPAGHNPGKDHDCFLGGGGRFEDAG
jgi:hypothetical protein